MLVEKIIFEAGADLITTTDHVAFLQLERSPVPLFVLIEGGDVDTTGHEDRSRVDSDGL
jgi:hypothetical protein